MGAIRENWRVVVLVLVLLGSVFALFSPTVGGSDRGSPGGQAIEGPTNLVYGLELAGGTRIRAPLVGVTAEDVQFGGTPPRRVERRVAGQLPQTDVTDVIVRRTSGTGTATGAGTDTGGTVEVTSGNVTPEELGSALRAAGYQYGTVRQGVTEETRQQTVQVLENKINEAGLSGGTVQQVTTATGEHFILVEVPNQNRAQVTELVERPGKVRIDVYYPTQENGSVTYQRREGVLVREDFQSIGTAQEGEGSNPPYVSVTVRESVAPEAQRTLVQTGVAQQGGSVCRYREAPNQTDPCLLLVVDGNVVNSFGMSPGLARSMTSGEWAKDPIFQLQTRNFSEARQVAIDLRAGALPARLDLSGEDGGTSSFISSAQGQRFKVDSLLTGIIAVLAVSAVVFLRYGKARVALPMIVTALSEVVILLGLAAAIQYPLDLSVIAGFIAVIGTGVDDLIIIADEVMAAGSVQSRRVFQSRFRRAFWVIGAAAATTIIAMSPLAVLSLGDLQGFALFTIFGVLIGVLLTRPAYGDILRSLITRGR